MEIKVDAVKLMRCVLIHSLTSGVDMKTALPFAIPADLTPDLARVLSYWRGLLRGNAKMPFSDDASLSDLPDISSSLFLINVFERPARYRFDLVGDALDSDGVAGRFLDETAPKVPFEFLSAQCAATSESAAPTFFRCAMPRAYGRLLLPLWADGHISNLLGAVDFS